MEQRSSQILRSLVKQYITSARPVASAHLARLDAFTISTATIRKLLQALEDSGYLTKPHTSAGRVPTDKGYRHYVDRIDNRPADRTQHSDVARRYHQLKYSFAQPCRAYARLLSYLVHNVVISARLASHDIQEAGLVELFDKQTQIDLDTFREIATIMANIDRHLTLLANLTVDNVAVFIGKENPFLNAKYTSLVAKSFYCANGEQVVLVIAGPKRMPYQHNIMWLEEVSNVIKQD